MMSITDICSKFADLTALEKRTYWLQVCWWFVVMVGSAFYIEWVDEDRSLFFLFKDYGTWLLLFPAGFTVFSIWQYAKGRFSVYGLAANLFVAVVTLVGILLLR